MASFASSSTTSYNFLSPPADSLKCSLCSGLAVEPWCHEDDQCGVIFCTECIRPYGEKPCPSCQMDKPEYCEDHKSKLKLHLS